MRQTPDGDWRPTASLATLRRRAELLARLRRGAQERYQRELSWDRFGDHLLRTLREAARRSDPCT